MRRRPSDLLRHGWLCIFLCGSLANGTELMTEHYPHSAMYRWQQKPVLRQLVLDDMEGKSTICRKVNLAELSLSSVEKHSGQQSLRMRLPVRGPSPRGNFREGKANYGFGGIAIENPELPWTQYNRFSCWVYAKAPGLDQLGLTMVLRTGYDEMVARTRHTICVREGQWCQLLWEFDDIPRDKTTGITVTFGLSGLVPDAEGFEFYFDDIELQQVEPDWLEGWEVRPDAFAFSHTGYLPGSTKKAIASGVAAGVFRLIDDKGNSVFQGPVQHVANRLGKFQLFDFTPLDRPGEYRIQAADRTSKPFRIGRRVWDRTVEKVLNFYYQERCGCEIPGVHGVCHTDVFCESDGKRIRAAAGAWHDAGDLSVPGSRCAESAYAMLQLHQQLSKLDGYEQLAGRALDEAVWGLDWILRTSFRDGNRSLGGKIGFYTDGVDDNYDDIYFRVNRRWEQFFSYAAVEATAARLLKTRNPNKAKRCLEMAREDYGYGLEYLDGKKPTRYGKSDLTAVGLGVMAACDLHDATGEQRFLDDAVRLASLLLPYQVRQKPEGLQENLCGWFTEYTYGEEEPTVRTFSHQAADVFTVEPFIRLCKKLPDHPDWMQWYSSIVLFSDFYLKRLCSHTAPYHNVPNGLFDVNFWKNSKRHSAVAESLPYGLDMGGGYYLRVFSPTPNWNFRGNTGTALCQTRVMSGVGVYRCNRELIDLAQQQLHWTVGMNPFSSSLMWGEGYDYTPYFTPQVGDIVGALPVGMKARGKKDIPYWPPTSVWNYKEVWIHPTAYWLWVMADLYADGRSQDRKPEVELSAENVGESLDIIATVKGKETRQVDLRTYNLTIRRKVQESGSTHPGDTSTRWNATVGNPAEPWIAVVVVDGNTEHVYECTGW